jgi:hypothetical protein
MGSSERAESDNDPPGSFQFRIPQDGRRLPLPDGDYRRFPLDSDPC